ncbi:unnamed protein product [Protopolystoma xenopodis]|uniref:Uncharacterized protein n=1 Tax=Protopolystoma xenopodis TaxID=117903 RepID=A0A448WES7_9PLAT|nr:unnamed protein product [Protopolystoma xenopodis]
MNDSAVFDCCEDESRPFQLDLCSLDQHDACLSTKMDNNSCLPIPYGSLFTTGKLKNFDTVVVAPPYQHDASLSSPSPVHTCLDMKLPCRSHLSPDRQIIAESTKTNPRDVFPRSRRLAKCPIYNASEPVVDKMGPDRSSDQDPQLRKISCALLSVDEDSCLAELSDSAFSRVSIAAAKSAKLVPPVAQPSQFQRDFARTAAASISWHQGRSIQIGAKEADV